MSESICQSVDKLNRNHTYSDTLNYWAPLSSIIEEEDEEEEEIEYKTSSGVTERALSALEQQEKAFTAVEQKETHAKTESMIIDSGATSHFATETINFLPHTGKPSTKQVYLPNGKIMNGSEKAELPNTNLPAKAKCVDVLPNLKQSLFSVGKVADEGYTTIFHPRNEGGMIHKEGTIIINSTEPAELQGWRARTGLWEFNPNKTTQKMSNTNITKANENTNSTETVHSVHSLPSMLMAIRFLHAAAGYLTKATWIKVIKAGNFKTWPVLTTENVSKHYPESDKTDKGHMKMQRMTVRSMKVIDKSTAEEHIPAPNKRNDV